MTAPTTPEHGLTPEVLGVSTGQDVIDRVVDAIRGYCGWHIWPAREDDLTVDGEGGRVLTLPTLWVSDVESVVENDVALAIDDYEWSASGDLKRVGRCWTTRWRGVQVALTHGYGECPFASLIGAVAGEVDGEADGGPMKKIGPFEWGATAGAGSQAILPYRGTLDLYRLPALP